MILANKLLYLLLIAHVIGDFYIQNDKIARDKTISIKVFAKHSLLYAAAILFMVMPVISKNVMLIVLIIAVTHAIIDYIKIKVGRKYTKADFNIFVLDQMLHIAVILIVSIVWGKQAAINDLCKWLIKNVNTISAITLYEYIKFIFIVLIIGKPVNIIIKKYIAKYSPSNLNMGYNNAGATIGFLERILIVILIMVNQYTAVGLVLTAKSIARYDMIIKEQKFAEYFLMGTLISLLSAISVTLMVK